MAYCILHAMVARFIFCLRLMPQKGRWLPMQNDFSADVVIVGGGGVGSAIAYFLSVLSGGAARVIVCEKDPTYERASTVLAAGGIRLQFSTPENVLMSQFGLEFLASAAEVLAVDGDAVDLGYHSRPYLRLVGAEGAEVAREQVRMQRELGATPTLLAGQELSQRYPWMHTEDVELAVLGGDYEGAFDPSTLLHAFRRKSIALGVRFIAGEVVGFDRVAGGAITAVRLANGEAISCARVVNAAGPRAGRVAALAGLSVPVEPIKAQTFSFRSPFSPPDCPTVLDHVGALNFKPEGDLFLAACPRDPELRDDDDFDLDSTLFMDHVWPALAHRVPQFDTLRQDRGWVGHIEWNTFDANAILGPHPECENFVLANGLSGHGVQHLPAVGRAIAELLVHGAYQSIDLSRFSYSRIDAGAPIRELV